MDGGHGAGAAILATGSEGAGVDAGGIGFALGAGVAWAVYLVATKDLMDAAPPVTVAALVFLGAAIALSPVAVISDMSWVTTDTRSRRRRLAGARIDRGLLHPLCDRAAEDAGGYGSDAHARRAADRIDPRPDGAPRAADGDDGDWGECWSWRGCSPFRPSDGAGCPARSPSTERMPCWTIG